MKIDTNDYRVRPGEKVNLKKWPTLGKPIAMGYVAAAFAQPGVELEIDIRGRAEPAKVVEIPFYQRPKHKG